MANMSATWKAKGGKLLEAMNSFSKNGNIRFLELFKKYAQSSNGATLTKDELGLLLRELMPGITAAETQYYQVMLDADHDGLVSYKELLRAVKEFKNAEKASCQGSSELHAVMTALSQRLKTEEDCKRVFSLFDKNGDGLLDVDEVRRLLKDALPRLTTQQLRLLITDVCNMVTRPDGWLSCSDLWSAIEAHREKAGTPSSRSKDPKGSISAQNGSRPPTPRGGPSTDVNSSRKERDTPPAKKASGGEDAGLEEIVEGEILPSTPGVYWEDIAGLEKVKRDLIMITVLPPKRPDIFKGLRAPPKGLLLFGPPGTGKTLLAKAVATETDATFFSLSASALTSKYYGQGEKIVRALFQVARKRQPAVIFLDEIDSVLSARSSSEHEASRRLKTEFLVQLDGIQASAPGEGQELLLVIGATNRPFDLDDAILRRFPRRVYIPLPDASTRLQALKNHLANMEHTISDKHLAELVRLTDGYSCSDITALCKEAVFGPIREIEDIEALEGMKAEDLRAVTVHDFVLAFHKIKASVGKECLGQFETWNAQFGGT